MAQRVGLWPRRAAARVRLGTAPSPLRSGAMSDRSPWMNEELRIFRRSVRRFVETKLAPHEPRWRAQHLPDPAAWTAAGRAGILLPGVPEEYGGGGGTLAHEIVVCEELARAGVHFAVHRRALHPGLRLRGAEAALAQADGFGRARRRDRDERARRRLRSAAIATTARRDGETYVVNGSKTFISNGWHASSALRSRPTPPS